MSPKDDNVQTQTRAGGNVFGEGARFLLTSAAVIIVMFGLREMRSLVVPIAMAAFLAIISYSVTDALRRCLRFPHWLAVASTVIVDFGVIFGIINLIKYLAEDMKTSLQTEVMVRFVEKYNDLMARMDEWGVGEQARSVVQSPQDIIDPQYLISLIQSITGQIVSFMSVTTLVLILMTFFLGEAPLFLSNFRNRLPNSMQGKDKVLASIKGMQRYLLIKTISSIVTGAALWLLCSVMDVPFAFLWGVVAFVLNYIPTIGSIVAAIPPVLLTVVLGNFGDVLIVAAGYVGVNCAIGNGIEPLFLGKQFGIATSVVLLSVLTWGWVLGPCGMLLAVPISVLLKLALENSRDLYWVAAIVDDNKTPSNQE